jgi:hypothetical protein
VASREATPIDLHAALSAPVKNPQYKGEASIDTRPEIVLLAHLVATDFVTKPSLATLVETYQPSLLGYAASAGPVVATDPASVNADCDNGAAV